MGAAVSAVLGLATASAPLTGGIGAAFGLADGTFRNYDDTFLVASDLPSLQNLVRTRQQEYRKSISVEMPSNYADATVVIIRYSNFCSFTGMKGLLNKSMTDSADPLVSRQRIIDAVASFQITKSEITQAEQRMLAEREASAKPTKPAPTAPTRQETKTPIVPPPAPAPQ